MRKENINLYSHVRTCYSGEVKSYDEVWNYSSIQALTNHKQVVWITIIVYWIKLENTP